MRLRLLLIVVVWGGLIAVHAAYKARPDLRDIARMAEGQAAPARWLGRLAPDIELTLIDGRPLRLADEVGRRVIILNFLASWCGPCRAEMPELERYQRRTGDTVRLIGIDAEETPEVVQRFIAEMKTTFPVAIDTSGAVLKRYGVSSFPTTVVIGADGRIKLYEVGAITNADVALGRTVKAEQAAIAAGHGITADAYRAALRVAPPPPATPDPTPDPTPAAGPTLTGRAKRIADAMPCPCGCDDQVAACTCRTADAIKTRLARGGYDGQSDAAVMEALNKEFCMKGM